MTDDPRTAPRDVRDVIVELYCPKHGTRDCPLAALAEETPT